MSQRKTKPKVSDTVHLQQHFKLMVREREAGQSPPMRADGPNKILNEFYERLSHEGRAVRRCPNQYRVTKLTVQKAIARKTKIVVRHPAYPGELFQVVGFCEAGCAPWYSEDTLEVMGLHGRYSLAAAQCWRI